MRLEFILQLGRSNSIFIRFVFIVSTLTRVFLVVRPALPLLRTALRNFLSYAAVAANRPAVHSLVDTTNRVCCAIANCGSHASADVVAAMHLAHIRDTPHV